MAKNLLVINVDLRETRVALIEDGIIAELHVERASTRSTLGNIVLGKVTRVLPGMQAAFIDVGLERAAFLHVEDLIRPDDFEAYLGGGKRKEEKEDEEDESPDEFELAPAGLTVSAPAGSSARESAGQVKVPSPAPSAAASDLQAPLPPLVGDPDPAGASIPAESTSGWNEPAAGGLSDPPTADFGDEEDGGLPGDEALADEEDVAIAVNAEDWAEPEVSFVPPPLVEATSEVLSAPTFPLALLPAEGGAALAPTVVADGLRRDDESPRARRGGRRASRTRAGRAVGRPDGGKQDAPPRDGSRAEAGRSEARGGARPVEGRQGDGRDGRSSRRNEGRGSPRELSRLSKSTPIRDVVREGQEVIVQISKEPIGTKGARVTSHVSLPGRYVVYMPTVDHIGISKRIGSDKERARLRDAIESMKPPSGGLIVRTVAEGLTKKQLKSDVGYLVRLWGEVAKKKEAGGKAPALLYQELDLVLKTARDLFTDDIEQIVIDDREQYSRLVRFVEMFMPERVKDILLYSGDEPIFDAYGIEDEIGRALSRKVPLPSGGYLIIDQAEALTAIDVNTGRYVGKGSKDLEDTLVKTNLEAVEEIAYQLRFRNLGGLIVLDLIDMERASNREKIRRRLEDLLQKDKAKTTLNRISDLGLIEMTRKRTRESLGRLLHEPCFYCDGTGQLQSKATIAYEILRQIRRDRSSLPGYSVVVNAHPAVIDLMKGEERDAVHDAERRFMRRIELVARKEYHLEQFDLVGK